MKALVVMVRQALDSPKAFLTTKREQRHSNLSRYISKDPRRDPSTHSVLETSARDLLSKSIRNAVQDISRK